MLVAAVVRAAVYGVYMVWHLVLIFQGSRDMARMPLSTFRYCFIARRHDAVFTFVSKALCLLFAKNENFVS